MEAGYVYSDSISGDGFFGTSNEFENSGLGSACKLGVS
jgi:hypothetical protein